MNPAVKEQMVLNCYKSCKEIVTPYKLATCVIINDFFDLRCVDPDASKPHYIRDFCVLILKLIQKPDLKLDELRSILTSGEYQILPRLINRFNLNLGYLNSQGLAYFLHLMTRKGKLIVTESEPATLSSNDKSDKPKLRITKTSVIGYYLRRILINFEKLSFSETTAVLGAFQRYYLESNDQPSLNTFESGNWYSNRDHWSRRQAELFIASQAALLSSNEEKAQDPKKLYLHIRNLLKSNPDLAEAHFLNYLNYLRVNEFCGSINSLYTSFDKKFISDSKGVDSNTKGYRFAALNLAILHFQFGHRDEALAALKESITLAQEANDNVCLQHALSWLYCLTHTNKDKLLQHSILKSLDLNLTYIASLGVQSFVQYAGVRGGMPKHIFETITRSDIINSQHTYNDLMSISYAQKSALWLVYGKFEMSSLWSQLLLHLNYDNNSFGIVNYGESVCQAMCNISNDLLLQGEYSKSYAILMFAKEHFTNEPISKNWMLCECLFTFIRSLHRQNWIEAEDAAQKMAAYDEYESNLRMIELYIHKRDFFAANKYVTQMLNETKNFLLKSRIDYHVRAMILSAEIQYISSYPNVTVPSILNTCLVHIKDFHLDYFQAIVYLHLAYVLLLTNMPAQALKLLNRSLIHILTHGGTFDRARAMLLYVKCLVANSQFEQQEERKATILSACEMLNESLENFIKAEAHSRAKEVLYLQAHLYNELGFTDKRNKCALEYRLLDEEYHIKNNHVPITLL